MFVNNCVHLYLRQARPYATHMTYYQNHSLQQFAPVLKAVLPQWLRDMLQLQQKYLKKNVSKSSMYTSTMIINDIYIYTYITNMLHFSLQVTSISNSCKTQSTHIQITFIILSVYLHVSMHAPKKSQLLKTRGFCRIGVNIQKFFITRAKHSSKELRMILFETNLNT